MILKTVISYLESVAPLQLQESYDNSGLAVGDPEKEITGALLTIDVTEEVVNEAIDKSIDVIISHHPVIFDGLKSLTGKNTFERALLKAIKNDIAVYSMHTNLDNIVGGVNSKIAEKIGLTHTKILVPGRNKLCKLVTFVTPADAPAVREAIFKAGAGQIGKYDHCSYNINGEGSFRGGDDADPYVGEKGKIHFEEEIRIETIFPAYIQKQVLAALLKAHPYEEVAYDIYPLKNESEMTGAGLIGKFENPVDEIEFLNSLTKLFSSTVLKHTGLLNRQIQTVAICGGSGSFLLQDAMKAGADIFISADFKYHQFFDADGKILIADVGHFESEQFTLEIFYELLIKKFPKFAVHFSEVNTNPIKYIK
jgi:dinuclear metal center YbgI/SA1388 family protein